MQDNIQLSPHFELREFTESATARKYGIVNEPPAEAVENLKALCVHTLEPLREAMGLPIIINSGYRCKALNDKLAHSSERSQHMKGQAADFYVGNGSVSGFKCQVSSENIRERLIRAFRLILTAPKINFDQVIIYPNFIHVSYVRNGKNRRKITRGFSNGTYCALSRAEALALL